MNRAGKPFDKILIANRGEIACRVIRTCRRLGIATVAVYSDADANAQHVRLADEALHIGGSRPAESYLRGDVILAAAQRTGAQAIHPGYGFLSENADFADAVEQAGLVFIGPKAASMRKMGSKAGAKILMESNGVPVVPGYTGEDQSNETLSREAQRVGFPLMIKAAHGGGGKGMRIVRSAEEFLASLESCQRESRNAFGRDRVLLERYVESPRHIEFQIFGDAHGRVIHLNERECSAQRRYQKVIEETPSPFLTPELREKMGAAAVAAGRAIDYVNAGTVEFIVAPNGDFFFMEINTRLQVEHPVTEETLGLDLVELQLRVAAGEALPAIDTTARGHAIEVRLYAEDPEKNFLPGSGRLEQLAMPTPGEHVRIDSGVIEGDTVTIFYDPMIAKLIVHDHDRPSALARLRDALTAVDVIGPKSNVEFLEKLIRHPIFVDGKIHTAYLDQHLDEVLPTPIAPDDAWQAIAAAYFLLDEERHADAPSPNSNDRWSPWGRADAFRIGHAGTRRVTLGWRDQRYDVSATGHDGDYVVHVGDAAVPARGAAKPRELVIRGARRVRDGDAEVVSLRIGDTSRRIRIHAHGHSVLLHDGERRIRFEHLKTFGFEASDAKGADRLIAPMPGRIVALKVSTGTEVAEGDELIVMEAMKMELSLKAPRAGTVASVSAKVGDFVEADAVLVRLGETA